MDAKTRRILIIVCVVAFLLTSTFTWAIISYGMQVAQQGVALGKMGAEKTHDIAQNLQQTTVEWVLTHASAFLVPVFFLGAIIWLATRKTKETSPSS